MELKPEHQPKKESLFESGQRMIRERYGEPTKTVYRVEEWTDSYDQDDNFIEGRARCHDSSKWMDTKEEAEELMSKMKPSSNYYGAYLKIAHRTLYRKWIEAHWQETWL